MTDADYQSIREHARSQIPEGWEEIQVQEPGCMCWQQWGKDGGFGPILHSHSKLRQICGRLQPYLLIRLKQ